MKKSSILVGGLITAMTFGSVAVATASPAKKAAKSETTAPAAPVIPTIPGGPEKSDHNKGIDSVLAGLVTSGKITQAQADAILAGFAAAHAAGGHDGMGPMGPMDPKGAGGPHSAEHAAGLNTILTTLGITAADLDAARVAGKSLATLAGAKTTALINALVALENSEIDARVTAGTMTAAQATTAKANVVARVTAHVNATPGAKGAEGPGGLGRHGH